MSTTSVTVRVEGKLGCLQWGGEAAATTLDEPSLARLLDAVQGLVRDPRVERLLVGGSAGRFVTGVDVGFFLDCLDTGRVDRILAFTRAAHHVLNTLARSPKPVVAWVNGPAYGGGLELALACHRIVAGPKAKFCLPETGLGIYPGMGGTQRLPRRIGVGLAKWMIYTGAIVPADHASRFGLVDAEALADASASEAIAALDQPRDVLACEPRFRLLAEFFSRHTVDMLLDPTRSLPTEPSVVRAVVQMRAAAPLRCNWPKPRSTWGSPCP